MGTRKGFLRIAKRGWLVAGWAIFILATVLLIAYFALVSGPGAAFVSGLLEEQIRGTASVGSIDADPLSGTVFLKGVALRGADGEEVVQLETVEAAPRSLSGKVLDRLRLTGLMVKVVLDEDGRLNLQSFLAKKKEKPSKPTGYAVRDLSVDRSEVLFESPYADLHLAGLTVSGAAQEAPGGAARGNLEASVVKMGLTPKAQEAEEIFAGLAGVAGPYNLGPFQAVAEWGNGVLSVKELKLALGGMDLRARGRLEIARLWGEGYVSGWSEGREAFAFSTRLDEQGWYLALLVNQLSVPGVEGSAVEFPPIELTGMNFTTVGDRLTLSLKRLNVARLRLSPRMELVGLSVSSNVRFESRGALSNLVMDVANTGVWDALALLARSWKNGRLTLLVLVDEVLVEGKVLVRPLRLRIHGKPAVGKVELNLAADLFPLGSVDAGLALGSDAPVAWSGTVTVTSLDVSPLVSLLDVPAMLKSMLGGTLSGRVELAAEELGSPMVRVSQCRFELKGRNGTIVLSGGGDDTGEVWDFSVEPEVSLFSREIRFGPGKLVWNMGSSSSGEK